MKRSAGRAPDEYRIAPRRHEKHGENWRDLCAPRVSVVNSPFESGRIQVTDLHQACFGLGGGVLQRADEIYEFLGQTQRCQVGINHELPVVAETQADRASQLTHGVFDLMKQRITAGQVVDGAWIMRTQLSQPLINLQRSTVPTFVGE